MRSSIREGLREAEVESAKNKILQKCKQTTSKWHPDIAQNHLQSSSPNQLVNIN